MKNPNNDLQIDNLPNRITLFRVVLIPLILACMMLTQSSLLNGWVSSSTLAWMAGWTFVGASLTDLIDGIVARRKNIITVFGSFLDPIADKFLVVSVLMVLLAHHKLHLIVVIVLVLREFYMTSLRLLAANEGVMVPVGSLGKWKTAFQMIGIPLLIVSERPWEIPMDILGQVFIYLSAFLSLCSATMYSLGIVNKIKQSRKKQSTQSEAQEQHQDEFTSESPQ